MAKRVWRNDMPQTQKDKIAQANTGKHLSDETKAKISAALCDYWASLPTKPITASGNTASTGITPTQPPLPRSPYRDY